MKPIVGLALLILLLQATAAQETPAPGVFDDYSLEEAAALVKEIAPLVETAAGARFKKMPAVEFIESAAMIPILAQEFRPQLANLYPGYSQAALDELAENHASSTAPILLGKYGLDDGILYLLPANLPVILSLTGVAPEYARPILKLIIAHELVHALQDQVIGLKRLRAITGLDEMEAFAATIEGHAVFLQELVGKSLGLEEAVIEFSRLLSAGSASGNDAARDILAKSQALKYEQIYLGGRTFIAYHQERGGTERLWEILKSPPKRTSMIAEPASYGDEKKAGVPYDRLLAGLERELGVADWLLQNLEVGRISLRAAYAGLEEKEREEIVSRVEHAQAFIAQRQDPFALVNVSIIVLKDQADVGRFFQLVEEMARRNLKEFEKSDLAVTDVRLEDFSFAGAARARKLSFNLSQRGAETVYHQLLVRIARENIILEISAGGHPLPDTTVRGAAAAVFTRYDQYRR